MLMIKALRIKSKKVRNFKQWLEYAGKDHLSHRIHHLGMTDRQAVLTVYILSSILGLLAYQIHVHAGFWMGLSGLAAYALACLVCIVLLDRLENHGKAKNG